MPGGSLDYVLFQKKSGFGMGMPGGSPIFKEPGPRMPAGAWDYVLFQKKSGFGIIFCHGCRAGPGLRAVSKEIRIGT